MRVVSSIPRIVHVILRLSSRFIITNLDIHWGGGGGGEGRGLNWVKEGGGEGC